jgi:hypothetical protein
LLRNPAKEIAAPNHNPDLYAQCVDIGNLLGDFGNLYGIQTEPIVARQCLS